MTTSAYFVQKHNFIRHILFWNSFRASKKGSMAFPQNCALPFGRRVGEWVVDYTFCQSSSLLCQVIYAISHATRPPGLDIISWARGGSLLLLLRRAGGYFIICAERAQCRRKQLCVHIPDAAAAVLEISAKNASACTHVRIGKVPRRIWIGSRERRRKHSIHLCSQFIICFVIGKTETHSIRGAFAPLSARFHFIMHPARKLPICCFLFAPQPQLHKFYDSLWMSWGIFSLPGVPRVTCNIVWKNWCKIGLGHQLLWQIYVNQKH